MNSIQYVVQNNTRVLTETTSIDCNKRLINAIAFKVVGDGTVNINGMPVDKSDGIVSYGSNMPVRDMTEYSVIIPTGTVVYVTQTVIIKRELVKVEESKTCN
jgi:hypothetical protein